ncbi:MAG: helix-turn-helix domain-containing protein [Lachnospiraceae bacterium]|nr:helix-turn-helix domain-containing protein [Lachnospiraceae bacterium]
MQASFAETIKQLRLRKKLSQQELADMMYVDRSTLANWENGRRLPDASMISRLAKILQVDPSILLNDALQNTAPPNVIIVDDESTLLTGAIHILTQAMPGASVIGFNSASEALSFARGNRVDIAFLDIEIGKTSGLELCKKLIELNPLMNVIYLTAYPDYSLSAWGTPACGFLVKPLHIEDVEKELKKLKNPVGGLHNSRIVD